MQRGSRWLSGCGLLFSILVASSHTGFPQTTSSALLGSVEDQSGAAIPNANITLIHEATRTERTSLTSSQGLFTVPGLLTGIYTIRVQAPNFSVKTLTGIRLSANEQLSVGAIGLQVGTVGQEVAVSSTFSQVQTASSERSTLITGQEINELALKGRDLMDMFRLQAGVVDLGATREAPAPSNFGNIYINGARSTQRSVFMDGVSLNNSGSNNYIQLDPAMDAGAEVQIINSSKQAEDGRNGGNTLNIISKGGGRDFHATAGWYFRNEKLNANSFFDSLTGTSLPIYLYNI